MNVRCRITRMRQTDAFARKAVGTDQVAAVHWISVRMDLPELGRQHGAVVAVSVRPLDHAQGVELAHQDGLVVVHQEPLPATHRAS